MSLRSTKTNEGASGRYRGIDNLDGAFNRAVAAREESTVYKMVSEGSVCQESAFPEIVDAPSSMEPKRFGIPVRASRRGIGFPGHTDPRKAVRRSSRDGRSKAGVNNTVFPAEIDGAPAIRRLFVIGR